MNFRYIKCVNSNPLIQNFYELKVDQSSLPLQSKVIPSALSQIVYIKTEKPLKTEFKNDAFKNKGLVVLGQSYKSYNLTITSPCVSFGINFHPTALYKILKTDINKLTDKHINLSKIDNKLFELLDPIFEHNLKGEMLAKKIENQLLQLKPYESKNTKLIDETIKVIYQKQGRLNVEKLLKIFPISQKHLETQFKKTIGLTPIKFIKLYKFISLMKQYQSKKESLTKLIDYYGYCDQSHFIKDFKLFMNQKPSDYFKSENIFLNKYLNP